MRRTLSSCFYACRYRKTAAQFCATCIRCLIPGLERPPPGKWNLAFLTFWSGAGTYSGPLPGFYVAEALNRLPAVEPHLSRAFHERLSQVRAVDRGCSKPERLHGAWPRLAIGGQPLFHLESAYCRVGMRPEDPIDRSGIIAFVAQRLLETPDDSAAHRRVGQAQDQLGRRREDLV